MTSITLTWTLRHHGWAICEVADRYSAVEAIASYVTDGPEQFLTAVARIVSGATAARAEFEAEPTVYRWTFHRHASDVEVHLLRAPSYHITDTASAVIWTSTLALDALARAVVRAFDDVAYRYGEDGYEQTWGRPFPTTELQALRTVWRQMKAGANVADPPAVD